MRNARHSYPRRRRFNTPLCKVRVEKRQRTRIDVEANAECLGYAFGCYIVVGRAYAASRKHVGVASAKCVDRIDNIRLVVGNDAHLFQPNANARQMIGDIADIAILGAARQDFVSNN